MALNGIVANLENRKPKISVAAVQSYARQRVAKMAQDSYRWGAAQGQAELINEAVNNLICHLYTQDGTGMFYNVDYRTGRLLIPAPWGSKGHRRWGLYRSERNILKNYLMLVAQRRKPAPLFHYERGRWYADIERFPNVDAALAGWRMLEVTPATVERLRGGA